MTRQPIAEVLANLPERLPRISETEVVRPSLHLPVQPLDGSRSRCVTLTAIRQLVDLFPLPLERIFRRLHVLVSLAAQMQVAVALLRLQLTIYPDLLSWLDEPHKPLPDLRVAARMTLGPN